MNGIQKLKEYLAQAPKDNFLRHALALEYIKEGNDAEAEILFKNILNEFPGYIGSYYHLGKLLERKAETEAAIECYERGMQEATKQNDNHAYNELQNAHDELI